MKLKKIESEMSVRCTTEEDAKELIKWAYECGFKWDYSSQNETNWSYSNYTLYYFHKDKSICYSHNDTISAIEFSDLIIPDQKFNIGDIVKSRDEEELNQYFEVVSVTND